MSSWVKDHQQSRVGSSERPGRGNVTTQLMWTLQAVAFNVLRVDKKISTITITPSEHHQHHSELTISITSFPLLYLTKLTYSLSFTQQYLLIHDRPLQLLQTNHELAFYKLPSTSLLRIWTSFEQVMQEIKLILAHSLHKLQKYLPFSLILFTMSQCCFLCFLGIYFKIFNFFSRFPFHNLPTCADSPQCIAPRLNHAHTTVPVPRQASLPAVLHKVIAFTIHSLTKSPVCSQRKPWCLLFCRSKVLPFVRRHTLPWLHSPTHFTVSSEPIYYWTLQLLYECLFNDYRSKTHRPFFQTS